MREGNACQRWGLLCFANASKVQSVPKAPADLATLHRTLAPDAAEVAEWYRLAKSAFSNYQLTAFGINNLSRRSIESGKPPSRQLWRSIWVAYSFAYAPGNLASPYAWATWGRFNRQNQFTADLIARRWAAKNKERRPWRWGRAEKARRRKRAIQPLIPSAAPLFLPPL